MTGARCAGHRALKAETGRRLATTTRRSGGGAPLALSKLAPLMYIRSRAGGAAVDGTATQQVSLVSLSMVFLSIKYSIL